MRPAIAIFWLCLLTLAGACSSGATNPAGTPGGPAVCSDGPRVPAATVHRRAAVLGPTTNVVRKFGGALWIVQSGSNTVARFDLATERHVDVVDVGDGRNPVDVWVGPDAIWITNYLSNTVTVADKNTGRVLDEVSGFDGPTGITGTDRYVYVGDVQFQGDNQYGPGDVTVLDRASHQRLATVTTSRQNPQFLATVGGRVVVVDSGVIDLTGRAHVTSEGAVELWSETSDPAVPDIAVATLPLVDDDRIGAPGYPAKHPGDGRLYFASGTAPVVFELDSTNVAWIHGSDDPIRLYDSKADTLNHAAMGPGGVLYVAAFNDDAIYLLDTTCDAPLGPPISVESTEMLAGPQAVVPVKRGSGVDLWYALSLADELGRVHLDFNP